MENLNPNLEALAKKFNTEPSLCHQCDVGCDVCNTCNLCIMCNICLNNVTDE